MPLISKDGESRGTSSATSAHGMAEEEESPIGTPSREMHEDRQNILDDHEAVLHDESSSEDADNAVEDDTDTDTFHDDDNDSAFDTDEFASETATLSSDTVRYRQENGRTYHSYGSTEHWGPNDTQAMHQQDLSHHFWTILLEDQFFLAPVKSPQRILDLGTGTGIWAIDVADRYPAAEVKGIDLSPIQPAWIPPNCHFEIDDYNISDWDLTPRYDLIHARELLGSVLDWPNFFAQALKGLKPGGWMECVEPDIHVTSDFVQLPDDFPPKQWVTLFREVGQRSGMTFEPATQLKGWLEGAGFENVTEKIFRVPIGAWAEDSRERILGLWNQVRLSKGMRDFTERRMRNFMGWEDNDIDTLIALTRAAVHDSNLCTHQNIYFVWGQKPYT